MKYATSLTLLNNPVKIAVGVAANLNCISENAVLFENFMGCCHDKSYSIRTREAYWGWVKRFILFHRKREPPEMGTLEVEQFLTHLDVQGRVTASTRNQALSALVFLYREVLHQHCGELENAMRTKLPRQLLVGLTADEVTRVLCRLNGGDWLVASLLFGTGMRILECIRLRVKDICIAKNEILVRDVRGELVRRFKIPSDLHQPLNAQMEKVLEDHCDDMKSQWQGVYVPEPLQIDNPNVSKLFAWQYVFAAKLLPRDPSDGKIRRYHIDERELQRTLEYAALAAGVDITMGSHALRTSFETRPLSR